MIQVEKGLPMPTKAASSAAKAKYPWDSMGVTDSFFVQGKNEGKTKRYLVTLVSKMRKKYGKKFMVDEVPTGVRVFCVASGLGTAVETHYNFITGQVVKVDVSAALTDKTAGEVVEGDTIVEAPVVEPEEAPVD